MDEDMAKLIIDLVITILLISLLGNIYTNIKEYAYKVLEMNYEIEKMKIEKGTYERKEVNITNEGNEKSNKPITFLEI